MPFDAVPTETKPDVFSLDGLIAWLETMPVEGEYDYWAAPTCNGGCMLHEYLWAKGFDPDEDYTLIAHISFPGQTESLQWIVAGPCPWTYGAALARAKALRDQTP